MMKLTPLAAVCLLATAASMPATAHESVYRANLSGPAEAPPNASPGFGTATVTLDFDLFTMRVETSFSGLLGPVTAAHLHCCTAVPGAGTVGVASVTPSFTGFPIGATSGSYDHTYDMTALGSYSAGFLAAHGGTASTAFNALNLGLFGGQAYLNVHTRAFPGGEIRGFLAFAPPVPEPSTYAMMLGGLGLAAFAARRRCATA